MSTRVKSSFVTVDEEVNELWTTSCIKLPVLPTHAESRWHIPGSVHGQIKPGGCARINVPHQYVVLGDGDVVGMHGEPDTLLHLRGESPRLAGALTSLLPCAPEQEGTEGDRVNTEQAGSNPGTCMEEYGKCSSHGKSMESQLCTLCTRWKATLTPWTALTQFYQLCDCSAGWRDERTS